MLENEKNNQDRNDLYYTIQLEKKVIFLEDEDNSQ
jgi:hypothetical protein